MNIKQILKQPINRVPVSAQFIQTKKVEKTKFITPVKKVADFDEKGKEQIENWLAISVIATNMLDVSTKALTRMGVIHERNAVFDLITAFKDLGKYFHGNENFDAKNIDLDGFIFSFLHSDEETQNRTIKFLETILNKKAKINKQQAVF